mmetsp:Transcript_38662/g.63615  ORF Transcript_38662/g.63615 Transcript_38662/m.63615 type:complete len:105 (-) Transcript_38662:310-624(-)
MMMMMKNMEKQIIITVGMCWEKYHHTQRPSRPVQSYRNKKNTSCTIEAIMKHMLVPIKNFCIQSLGEDVSQLITGFGIVHLDGPKVHLLLSQVVVGHMKVPGFP